MSHVIKCARVYFLLLIGSLLVSYFLLNTQFFVTSKLYLNYAHAQLSFVLPNDDNYNKRYYKNTSNIRFQPDQCNLAKDLFVTALPNHGAGIGHQFGEWIQGLWAAYMYNITYVYTPFLVNSAHWNSFLGFGDNETVENDLKTRYDHLNILEFRSDRKNSISTKDWILEHRRKYASHYSNNNTLLLRLYRINNLVSVRNAACFLPINRKLRMKYCVARLYQPVQTNLYEDDIRSNRFIVAVHLRCGDSCYNTYRATSLTSIENTLITIHKTVSEYYRNKQVAIHIFSQAPKNNTAENHFHLLLHSKKLLKAKPLPVKVITHFSLIASVTLHHLITADMLLTAQSGFSQLATILRVGITFGAIQSCDSKLAISSYNRITGNFSVMQLRSALHHAESIQEKQI